MNAVDPFSELNARQTPPSERVLDALRAEILQNEQPRLEPRHTLFAQPWTRRSRVLLSAGILFVALHMTSPRALGLAPGWVLLVGVLYSALSGLLLFYGGIRGNMRGLLRGPRLALVLAVPLLTLLWLGGIAERFSLQNEFLSAVGMATARSCFLHSLGAGSLCTFLLLLVWRRSDPFAPASSGALLGMLGGLLGTLSTHLGCLSREGFHLTLAHGLAVVMLCGIGSFAGRKWMTP